MGIFLNFVEIGGTFNTHNWFKGGWMNLND